MEAIKAIARRMKSGKYKIDLPISNDVKKNCCNGHCWS